MRWHADVKGSLHLLRVGERIPYVCGATWVWAALPLVPPLPPALRRAATCARAAPLPAPPLLHEPAPPPLLHAALWAWAVSPLKLVSKWPQARSL
jgi:hypothetical protein